MTKRAPLQPQGAAVLFDSAVRKRRVCVPRLPLRIHNAVLVRSAREPPEARQGTARPGARRARGTAMTRHYHDIGGGADLVLPRRRRAAALLSLWLTKTYVTRSSGLKYPSIARTCRRGGDAGPVPWS